MPQAASEKSFGFLIELERATGVFASCAPMTKARVFQIVFLALAIAAARGDDLPPREVPLVEKKWDDLANHDVSANGTLALAMAPQKWKHAETDHFIIHFRRATEAHKVAREIEYDIWFVAKSLGAKPEQYKRKSHVYVFEDDPEWETFLV